MCFVCALECLSAETISEHQSEWIGFVKSSSLNMRSGPGPEHGVVQRIPYNECVNLVNEDYNISDEEEWVEVTYNGVGGYVSKEFLAIQKNPYKSHHYNQKRYPGLSFLPVPGFMPKRTPLWSWNLGIITLLLTIVLLVIYSKNDFPSPFKSSLAVALSCSVFYYALSFGEHAMWFLNLTETGNDIGYVCLNGLLILIFIALQFWLSIPLYLEYNESTTSNIFLSYASVIIGGAILLVSLIISKFWLSYFLWIGIGAVIISQIIQLGMVWRKTNGLIAVSILVTSSATILLCIPLLYIMATIVMGIIAIALARSPDSVNSGIHRNSVSSNTMNAQPQEKVFLEDSSGKKVEVELDSSGQHAEEKHAAIPRRFRKKFDGSFEEY